MFVETRESIAKFPSNLSKRNVSDTWRNSRNNITA